MNNAKNESESTELTFSGEHEVPLSKEDLWDSLNDPDVLQVCIRGCHGVEKVSENTFRASFRFKVGPISKTFSATLNVVNPNPPSGYALHSAMNAGIAGSVSGEANVSLVSQSARCTRLNYHAVVNASGWIGELGVRVLGSTAEKYMQKFFEKLVAAAESQNLQRNL